MEGKTTGDFAGGVRLFEFEAGTNGPETRQTQAFWIEEAIAPWMTQKCGPSGMR